MKMTKRLLVLMLTVMLMFSAVSPAFAQVAPPEATVKAGDTIDVEFKYESIAGINGTFTYSNSDLFAGVDVKFTGLAGIYNPNNGTVLCFAENVAPESIITISLTVSDDAVEGDTCTITFEYEIPDSNGQLPAVPEWKYESVTITIGSSVDYTELNRQINIAEGLNELEYSKKSWDNSNIVTLLANAIDARNSNDQGVVDAAAKALADAIASLVLMNEEELNKQIGIANGLVEAGQGTYTNKSWKAMTDALEIAKAAVGCRNQETVDAAAKALAEAIAALKKVDYTALEEQIAIAESLEKDKYTEESWKKVEDALAAAKEALNSRDQEAVDAATIALKNAIAALQIPPTGDTMIIFLAMAALAAIAMAVLLVIKNKKRSIVK